MSTEPEDVTPDQTAPDETLADAVSEAVESIADQPDNDVESIDLAGASSSLEAERDRYYEQWKRTQAELENFRKRAQREMETEVRYRDAGLIRDLLPALDNLTRSVQAAEQTGNVEELLQGLQMILSQFDQVLVGHSAAPIKTVGEPFDPNLHEALQQIPTSEHPPMTVLQEIERGYILHDRVIRPGKVLVASALPQPVQEDGNKETSE